jgi:RNA polymerase sigma factor (sigma-70 family)
MAEALPNPLLPHIRHLIGSDPAAALTDGQLLERFLADRDETAMEVLVRRYGRLVLGVCRRVLRNADAAEDAFQAAFLVLIRRARALDRGKPLGGWLYTVAYRLALCARANEARRQQCEAQAARNRSAAEPHATTPCDAVVALEEELNRLPEKHRAVLVLCYLEGKTNEQAAAILGCPRGSMSARLAQARDRLRSCLARRGYAVPAAGLATLLAGTTTQAAVPLPLLSDTVRAAVWFAGEHAATAGIVSTQAVALARSACRAMFVHKLKIAAAVLLVTAMLGTGATMLLKAASQAIEQPPPEAGSERAEVAGERLPRGAVARMGTTQLRHGDAVFFAAYTPDGKALLTAGKDRTVRLWDLGSGKEIRRFDWGPAQPDRKPASSEDGTIAQLEQSTLDEWALGNQVALSSDGQLVAASRGGAVGLWETATGKSRRVLQTDQKRLIQLAFSADGKSLLTLGPGGQATAVWDVATGRCIQRSQGNAVIAPYGVFAGITDRNAVVSPGWKYLAFVTRDDSLNRWIHIRDLATGKEVPPIFVGLYAGPQPLCFSADDKTLAWDDDERRAVVCSDAATGKELRRLEHPRGDSALAIALAPDAKALAVCRVSHTIELWDLKSGQCSCPVGKASNALLQQVRADWRGAHVRPALAFSSDARKLVCSLGGETLRQFQADSGAEIPGPDAGRVGNPSHNSGHRGPVSTLALSADGTSLYTCGHGGPVRVWDWITGKETGQRAVPGSATHVVFAADGRLGFAADYSFVLHGADGKKTWPIAAANSAWVPVSVALSPDGTLVATRSWPNPAVHLRDATTGTVRRTLGQPGDDAADSTRVLTEMTGVVPADLVFSPDGCCLAGAGPMRQLCLWDVATGTLLWQLAAGAGPAIERFAFSANSHCLATLNADHSVTLYEAATGGKRGRLGTADPNKRRVHLAFGGTRDLMQMRGDVPVCLAFSADGRYLATAQHTSEIHLWDMLAGREVGQLQGHDGGVVSLLFAPDGKHLFSGGTDTTVLTWDLARLIQPRTTQAAKLPPQALDGLWTDLADTDSARAFDALRQLSASPDQAVGLIKERLRAATPADPKRLAQLLADLDCDRFELRRQAESELQGLGERAEPALRQALAGDPPPELRQRLERLRDRLFVPTPGLLRDLRAVELLELIGNPEARQMLGALAGGTPGARLTREAHSALQRLTKQAATP